MEAVGPTALDAVAGVAQPINVAIAVEHGHHGGVAARRDVDAVVTRTGDHECQGGCVHLIGLTLVDAVYAQVEDALGELDLGEVVVQVEQVEAGATGQPNGRCANVQLGTRVVVGVEHVTGEQGAVALGLDPDVRAGSLEADGALEITQACDTTGRVRLDAGGAGDQSQGEACQPSVQRIASDIHVHLLIQGGQHGRGARRKWRVVLGHHDSVARLNDHLRWLTRTAKALYICGPVAPPLRSGRANRVR